jgi:NAD(P)-dependent dehydrogenase (short-subunit alcohol dehydrogenase family)
MKKHLNGLVAQVTGGSHGIGPAVVQHLAQEGMAIALGDQFWNGLPRSW